MLIPWQNQDPAQKLELCIEGKEGSHSEHTRWSQDCPNMASVVGYTAIPDNDK